MKASGTQKQENLWISIAANVIVPALLLSKGKNWFPAVEPWAWLLIALAFPCVYFLYDWLRRRKANFISVVGFAGTLLTGGIGLMKLAPVWMAVKEAAVPALIAVLLAVFPRRKTEKFLLNPQIFDVEKIEKLCAERGSRERLSERVGVCMRPVVFSFVLSAVLNFVLTKIIVVSDPAENLEAFNTELGRLVWVSWIVIVLPCMAFMAWALFLLFKAIADATGTPAEELLAGTKNRQKDS